MTQASSTLVQEGIKDGNSTALGDRFVFYCVVFWLVVSRFRNLHR